MAPGELELYVITIRTKRCSWAAHHRRNLVARKSSCQWGYFSRGVRPLKYKGIRVPIEELLELEKTTPYWRSVPVQVVRRLSLHCCAERFIPLNILPSLLKWPKHISKSLIIGIANLWPASIMMAAQSMPPFDGIIVTAATTHMPETLIKQLNTGGAGDSRWSEKSVPGTDTV